MKAQRVVVLLALLNVGLVMFSLWSRVRPVEASGPADVLRAHKLEIVDAQGKVRASIQVIPAGPARRADGSVVDASKTYPEAVVLRLIRPDGRPSVKIATTQEGSGLDLSGGVDPTYIVLGANGGDASIVVRNKDGREQTVKPSGQ